MQIIAPHKMDKGEIEKKMREAEQFAEDDKRLKEQVEMKNEAEALVYTSEKTIADLGDKLSTEQKEAVKKATEELKEALKKNDPASIKSASDALKRVLQDAGSSIYKGQGGQGGSGGSGTGGAGPDFGGASGGEGASGSSGGDGNTYDADYKKV